MISYLLPSKNLYLKLKIYKKRKLFRKFLSNFKIFLLIFKFLYLKYVSYSFLRKFLIIRYLSIKFLRFLKFIYNIKQLLFFYRQYLFFSFLQKEKMFTRFFLKNYYFFLSSKIEKVRRKKYYYKTDLKILKELENKIDAEELEFEEIDSKKLVKTVLLTQKNIIRNDLIIQKLKIFLISGLSNHFLLYFSESVILFLLIFLNQFLQILTLQHLFYFLILLKFLNQFYNNTFYV